MGVGVQLEECGTTFWSRFTSEGKLPMAVCVGGVSGGSVHVCRSMKHLCTRLLTTPQIFYWKQYNYIGTHTVSCPNPWNYEYAYSLM